MKNQGFKCPPKQELLPASQRLRTWPRDAGIIDSSPPLEIATDKDRPISLVQSSLSTSDDEFYGGIDATLINDEPY